MVARSLQEKKMFSPEKKQTNKKTMWKIENNKKIHLLGDARKRFWS
jgi:hypothetical protein